MVLKIQYIPSTYLLKINFLSIFEFFLMSVIIMKVKVFLKSFTRMIKLYFTSVKKSGNGVKESDADVIISLTTIPYRLPKLHFVIRSLLNQTVSFNKIILWINEDLEFKVPNSLNKLQSDRFEIKFSKSNSSHRKLVETLKIYPNKNIVTCDDVLMYPNDWLERLLMEHDKHPEAIVAHMCRTFTFDKNGLMPYRKWRSEVLGESSDRTLAIGYGGVFYPPYSLHDDVLNESLYMKLAPKADDLWFKAMALKKGTSVFKSAQPNPQPTPIIFTQKYSLKKENIGKDANREQWMNISDYYGMKVK